MEDKKTKSMMKIKLIRAEMILKKRISNCLNLLPNDLYMEFASKFSSFNNRNHNTPLSASRAKRAKESPYFIWDDLMKLQDSLKDFFNLAQQVNLCCDDEVLEKSKHYLTLVEGLVETLQQIIFHLCESSELPLPTSFPRDLKSRVGQDHEADEESSSITGLDESELPTGPEESKPLEGPDKSTPPEGLDES